MGGVVVVIVMEVVFSWWSWWFGGIRYGISGGGQTFLKTSRE